MNELVHLTSHKNLTNKKDITPLDKRLRASCKYHPYSHPPDAYYLDHILHGETAKLTGGISPIALGLAGIDWWSHLIFSPSKQHILWKSFLDKTVKITEYSIKTTLGVEAEIVISPQANDHRFSSENWKKPPFNIIEQAFLLYQSWWDEATTNVRGVSDHHLNVVSYTARQMIDMVSPSNNPLINPDILQTTKEQNGQNFIKGFANFINDTARAKTGKQPAIMQEFKVGKDIAITKGKIVYRNELIELIQYEPTTAEVYAEPILIIPAWIMKYYILDLSPENSMVKYLVDKGHTVFMISWKNPDACDYDMGLADYLNLGIKESIKAIKTITNSQEIHGVGYCLGGTLLSIMAAAHARDNDKTFKTITMLASQIDFEEAGEILLFLDESQVSFLEDVMWNQGYLDKNQMSNAFEMLRPNDLIWSHIITNYMQGEREATYDMLSWNADTTRMPYRMHSEYLRQLFLQNDLAEGRFIVGDAPIALQDIWIPIFSVGTQHDHIAPWKSVYKILLLVSSDITFILASGGHNSGIVSEPNHAGRTFQMATIPNTAHYVPAGGWQKTTPITQGSWWDSWQAWLVHHSGDKIAPPKIGDNQNYAPLTDAPGQYVLMV